MFVEIVRPCWSEVMGHVVVSSFGILGFSRIFEVDSGEASACPCTSLREDLRILGFLNRSETVCLVCSVKR